MKARALLTILLVLSLAGCFGGDGDGGGGATTAPPTTTSTTPAPTTTPPPPVFRIPLLVDFDFNGCSGITVFQLQPLADIQPLLPEPFVAAPIAPVEGFPSEDGALAVDMYLCANLTTPNTSVPATYYGQVYTFVERPAELVPDAPESSAQEYVFRVLAGEDVLAKLWPAAGYDTHNGSATFELLGDPAPLRLAQATMGDYATEATGAANSAAPVTVETPFARYTRLADGSLLYWTGTYAFPSGFSGTGDATVPDDDVFAPFRGATGTLGGFALVYEAGAMLGNDLTLIRGL